MKPTGWEQRSPTLFWVTIILLMALTSSVTLNFFLHMTCGRSVAHPMGIGGVKNAISQALREAADRLPAVKNAIVSNAPLPGRKPVKKDPEVGAGAVGVDRGESLRGTSSGGGADSGQLERGGVQAEVTSSVSAEGNSAYAAVKWQWQNTTGENKKVLIDLGANCGNSYTRFVNMARNGKAGVDKRPFDRSYLFEWNPRIIRLYLDKLAKKDPKVVLVPNPAWGEDKTMTFYMDKRDEGKADEDYVKKYPCLGQKVNTFNSPEDSGGMLKEYGRSGTPVEVQAVGFPSWFVKQDIAPNDLIHLKIDIEGAECSVIDAWMDQGLTCTVQAYYVEWHDVFTPEMKVCATKTRNRLIEAAAKCQHKIDVQVW